MPIRPNDQGGVKESPWPEVAAHVLDLAASLDSLLATIQSRQVRDERNFALFNLGRRAMHEVRRVAHHLEDDVAEIAWSVRNLHEIDLTLRYILKDPSYLGEWQTQMVGDEKDIVEGFLSLGEVPVEQRTLWEQRLEVVKAACSRFALTIRRPWAMRHLARESGREQEYDAFFKFLSKYVHPSSWLVNGRTARTNAIGYRNLLVGLSQVLARRVYGILFDHFEIAEGQISPNARSSDWTAPEGDLPTG